MQTATIVFLVVLISSGLTYNMLKEKRSSLYSEPNPAWAVVKIVTLDSLMRISLVGLRALIFTVPVFFSYTYLRESIWSMLPSLNWVACYLTLFTCGALLSCGASNSTSSSN